MFGRHVRGPLDILQAAWSSDQANLTTAATWVQEMRLRLDDMRTAAWENQHKEQANMQKRYDKGATPRTLEVGDQVLALLPAGSGKLDTQWPLCYNSPSILVHIHPGSGEGVLPGTGS